MKWTLAALLVLGAILVQLTACQPEVPYDPFPKDPRTPPDCSKIDCE